MIGSMKLELRRPKCIFSSVCSPVSFFLGSGDGSGLVLLLVRFVGFHCWFS